MGAYFLLLSFFVCYAVAEYSQRNANVQYLQLAKTNPEFHFSRWVALHGKTYANDVDEYSEKYQIWLSNLHYVLEYNAEHQSHWLGMNSFADLTHEEYKRYLGYNSNLRKKNSLSSSFMYDNIPDDSLPAQIDWRELGAVTKVKNQAQCGSCWAFSTTGSVEGINKIVTGSLISLSEQELVDCDQVQDSGCNGGLMDNAFEFIIQNGGIDTEMDYPYLAQESGCKQAKKRKHIVSIDRYEDVPQNDEVALKKVVAHQPVSVAIEADQQSFQLYVGGVYDSSDCGTSLDHGVLVVGYGYEQGQGTYWLVKNSWGHEWGDQGYIKLKMGVDAKEGQCGIAMAASFPIKLGPNPSPEPEPSPGASPEPSPSPAPGPVACDDTFQCPEGSSCCCTRKIFTVCFEWGCCPMTSASCCNDGVHCCPSNLPNCDPASGSCKADSKVPFSSVPWSVKSPALKSRQSQTKSAFKPIKALLGRAAGAQE